MVIEFSSLLFFAVVFIYAGIITIINYNNDNTNYKIEFLRLCVFLSILFIVSETLFPIRLGTKFEGFEIFNMIPFKVVVYQFMNYSLPQFLYQVVGNIVLFVPLGYFLYLLTNRSIKKTLLLAFCTTLSVEFIQGFIPYRFCEIDDLWLNTLGTFIGLSICRIINKGYVKAKS